MKSLTFPIPCYKYRLLSSSQFHSPCIQLERDNKMMRTFLLSVAIFVLVLVSVAPAGAQTQTNEVKIYGYFFIADKVPAAFKDIEVMDIEFPPYVDTAKHAAPDYGRISRSEEHTS